LRYDPQLRGVVDPAEVFRQAEEALKEVRAALFGPDGRDPRSALAVPSLEPSRVTIYLFQWDRTIQEVFKVRALACAVPALNAVAVTYQPKKALPELLRHELTHLFVARPWNRRTPPLLSEGLPAWIERTANGFSVDRLAANAIGPRQGALRPLLNPKIFFHDQFVLNSYALAGSFTGFLLRRFGREPYLRFYNAMYDGRDFDARFAAHFGESFETAENTWRLQVVWGNDQPPPAGAV
jgi:hypothetical protein